MRIRTLMALAATLPALPGGAALADAPVAPELTRADAEAWLDGFLPYALGSADIAGAVVVVVKNGEVLLQKGYGYADVAARKPVDPALTLFRPGSVSKLFTWTAVMQLVEQGKLDLDADVNEYLDFRIPARDGKPVTLRNIMTHTAGFEEQVKGLMTTGKPLHSLDQQLSDWVPERIFAPGTTPAYSNYATALAGHIVARTSGLSFDDYIEQHIFAPLGMQQASFRQPLPAKLEPHMSKGYPLASKDDKPFEIVGPAPAGSLSASGADMARFMIAHLQKGAFGSGRILQETTAELMHGTALTLMPRVHRMLLGFYEEDANGHRIIGHAGDTQWFHSDLHLYIDDGVGLFFSVNSPGKEGAAGRIRTALFQQFTDRYLPGPTLDGTVDAKLAAEHAQLMTGTYDNSRRMQSSFFRLMGLAGGVKVSVNEDGTLNVPMARNIAGVPIKWREIEPFVWREVNGNSLLAAQVQDGRVVQFSFGGLSPFMVFEPSPATTSASWLLPVLLAGVAALVLTTLAWPISALVRRHYGAPYRLSGRDAQAHRWIRIVSSVVIVVLLAWVVTIAKMMGDLNLLTARLDGWLWVLHLLSAVVFVGAAIAGVWNALVVVRGARKWYAKLWAVVLALALLVVLWVAFAFNLVAFNVNY